MNSKPINTNGWSFGIISQFLWGTGGVVIKLIDTVIPGTLLVSIRHAIGACTLGLLLFRKKHTFKNIPIFHLILLGIIAAALPDLLLIEGVRRTGAIIATILARVEIPLSVLLAHIFLKEHINRYAYISVLLSVIGVFCISYDPNLAIRLDNDFYVGILCGLGAATLWAISSIYGKHILTKKTDPLALSFVRITIGSIFMLAATLLFIKNPFASLSLLAPTDWGLIIYLGVFLSGLAYLFFYKSLNLLDAHAAVILGGLSIVVLLLGGLLIGETILPGQWLGIAVIITSLFLVKKTGTNTKPHKLPTRM